MAHVHCRTRQLKKRGRWNLEKRECKKNSSVLHRLIPTTTRISPFFFLVAVFYCLVAQHLPDPGPAPWPIRCRGLHSGADAGLPLRGVFRAALTAACVFFPYLSVDSVLTAAFPPFIFSTRHVSYRSSTAGMVTTAYRLSTTDTL